MGHRITQRIIECAICKKIPDDGEYLWEMGGEYWCEDCCNKDGEEQEERVHNAIAQGREHSERPAGAEG